MGGENDGERQGVLFTWWKNSSCASANISEHENRHDTKMGGSYKKRFYFVIWNCVEMGTKGLRKAERCRKNHVGKVVQYCLIINDSLSP